jgi:fructose-bisphosphate aldolase class I
MYEKMLYAPGFVAALDQSGGSTPKALRLYGIPDDAYVAGETSMFNKIHEMRSRIMTSKVFNGERILASILFADTVRRSINGMPTAQYLWEEKGVVPIIKIDEGLEDEHNGVQLMKTMTKLNDLLDLAHENNIFGTKARSVIKLANLEGIKANVQQQFNVGKTVIKRGMVPILEPEVDIQSPEKEAAEEMLEKVLMENLNSLSADEKVMLKLTLPTKPNLYKEVIAHPNVVRVVALSGGYTRMEANELLAKNENMVASFSRALTEGLSANDTDEEFEAKLDESIGSIYFASIQ